MNTSLVIGILCLTFVYSFGLMTAEGAITQEYVNYTVNAGDSLWSIAELYNIHDKDTREVIYDIRQVNGLATSMIYPGQTIQVPIL